MTDYNKILPLTADFLVQFNRLNTHKQNGSHTEDVKMTMEW